MSDPFGTLEPMFTAPHPWEIILMTDTRRTYLDLAERWTAMWNGDLALADEILAPDFGIDLLHVVPDFASLVGSRDAGVP